MKNQKNLMFGILIVIIVILYFITLKIFKKKIYLGCLYSKTGTVGRESYANFEILKSCLDFALKEKGLSNQIEFVYITRDLGDDLNNYYKWVEYCVKNYNVKYFFGCWRSSERKKILPLIQKYNLRLFYPTQYEGQECLNNVYYFGGLPNQQLIPGLQYMISKYSTYRDIYIIGSDYVYPRESAKIVQNYVKSTYPDHRIAHIKFYPLNGTDFKDFLDILQQQNPEGAIIINLINGKSYYDFVKQLYHIKIESRQPKWSVYPVISFSIVHFDKEYLIYNRNHYFVTNFTDQLLSDQVYQLYYKPHVLQFFQTLKKKHHIKSINDMQYNTYLSAEFFVHVLSILRAKNYDLTDVDQFDNHKRVLISRFCGDTTMQQNNHANKIVFINRLTEQGNLKILYQSFIDIMPMSFYDKTRPLQCVIAPHTLLKNNNTRIDEFHP
jgi:hypothetical protein